MKIELNKIYRTRNGRKARIVCIDAKGNFPIVALVEDFDSEYAHLFTRDGFYYRSSEFSTLDLVSEWIDKPEFDWSKAAAWHVAIAMDSSKEWLAYNEVPELGDTVWRCEDWQTVPEEHAPKWTGDWHDSLIIRPGHEKKANEHTRTPEKNPR